ncbi:MAG TPA: prenyltransferase/squalene oxidase repeat-containing protein [Lacipirellulaceae bacterium]|jgi:hypothetical protein|nr:prenyltransferase/squalene oxidase repeat-containing protein [Lacipirellulaceae bacterium]
MALHEVAPADRETIQTSSADNLLVDASSMDGFIAPRRKPPLWRRAKDAIRTRVAALVGAITLPEDDQPTDLVGRLIGATPPWFVSVIVHFSFMILLGLAALKAGDVVQDSSSVEIELSNSEPLGDDEIYAETLGEQLDDPTQLVSSDGPERLPDEVVALPTGELPEVDDSLVGPPILDFAPDGVLAAGTESTPAIALEFSGREAGIKKALLKAYGGTALTEDAVNEGLRWLVRQQNRRGFWSLKGPNSNGSNVENNEAATAMALLAFQGAGYTPNSTGNDAYARVVTRGWRQLLRSQQSDGRFYANLVAEQHQLYTQAMCTIAVCELYGMTRDTTYLDAAQKAVDYCVKIQSPQGGWRYQPGVDSDLSVTGWFAMALQSARMAGVEVPSFAFDRIGQFLDSVSREEGSQYAYRPTDGATIPLTAEGLLTRQYLGWQRDDPRLRAGVDHLLANLPEWEKQNVYYWYYATQVCHHMEGPDWQKWNAVTRQLLPEHQVKRGKERGSWDPTNDRWGNAGGRLYVTCMSLYVLEVYYRHLPLYRDGLLGE